MLGRHAGESYAQRRAGIVLRRRGLHSGPGAFDDDATTLELYVREPFSVVVIQRCSRVLV